MGILSLHVKCLGSAVKTEYSGVPIVLPTFLWLYKFIVLQFEKNASLNVSTLENM